MRKAGRQGWVRVGLPCAAALFACKSAPHTRAPTPPATRVRAATSPAPAEPRFAQQPGTVIAQVDGAAVLALAAPAFASVSREQRLVAYWAAQALAAADALAAEQGYRHNRGIIRILRGILGRPPASWHRDGTSPARCREPDGSGSSRRAR